jgi:hypothetical protein
MFLDEHIPVGGLGRRRGEKGIMKICSKPGFSQKIAWLFKTIDKKRFIVL